MNSKIGIEPLYDLVIVEKFPAETMTKSGFIIPTMAQESLDKGTVVAIGPGKRKDDGTREEMDLKLDDVVYFSKYAREVVKIDGKEYVSMHEADVFGRVKPLESS